jgi:hypothetical protein
MTEKTESNTLAFYTAAVLPKLVYGPAIIFPPRN